MLQQTLRVRCTNQYAGGPTDHGSNVSSHTLDLEPSNAESPESRRFRALWQRLYLHRLCNSSCGAVGYRWTWKDNDTGAKVDAVVDGA